MGHSGSDNLSRSNGGDEMHLSKGEIEIHSVLPDIAFIPFPQNKRRQPNQWNRRMQIKPINFSWACFILKQIKMKKGESGYLTKDGSTEWKMVLKMKFLSGCFASQAVSILWQVCIWYDLLRCIEYAKWERLKLPFMQFGSISRMSS